MTKPSYLFVASGVVLVFTGTLLAQTTPRDPAPVQDVAAAMATSLAKQRAAVQRQTGQSESGTFFVLSPPAAMGANYPAPLTPDAAASSIPPPAAAAASIPPPGGCDPLPGSRIDGLVDDASRRNGLDGALLRTVMQQESGFRPCAVSPKGAMGLMQLMPATAGQFGVTDPFNPADNVEAGARFLKELMTRYNGDLKLVLGAYNAGPGRVDDAGGVPNIPETTNYIRRIMSLLPMAAH